MVKMAFFIIKEVSFYSDWTRYQCIYLIITMHNAYSHGLERMFKALEKGIFPPNKCILQIFFTKKGEDLKSY